MSEDKSSDKETKDDKDDDADEVSAEPVSKSSATQPTLTDAEKALAKKLRHKPKWKLFWIVSILSLVADQATKIWAREALPVFRYDGATAPPCVIPEDLLGKTPACGAEAVSVIDSFWHWRLSMNPGSAFGLFSGQGQAGRILLSIVGILAVFGMLWMLKKARPDQKVLHWALALVAGGAVGNLIDRIYYGVVTDFVLWHWGSKPQEPAARYLGGDGVIDRFNTEWPVFNVADIVLVVGVGLMFIDIQKEGKREKAKKKRRQERARQAGLVKDL